VLTSLAGDGLAEPEGLNAAGGGAEHALVVRLKEQGHFILFN
jgi:hypothetical protein